MNNIEELNKYSKFLQKKRRIWHKETLREYLISTYLNSNFYKINSSLVLNSKLFFE